MSAPLACRGTLEVEVEGAKDSNSDNVIKSQEDFIGQKLSLSFIKAWNQAQDVDGDTCWTGLAMQ